MVEADRALVRVLEVGPGLVGEGHDVGGELGVQGAVFQAPQVREVVAGDGGVGGVAEAGHGAQGGVGEGSWGEVTLADADGLGDAESLPALPGRAAGGVQAAGVAVADGGVGQGVGGLAQDASGEAGACVLGDGPVVGEVAAAAGGGVGEEGQGGGLAGSCPCLQCQVLACGEGVGCGGLFVGRLHV